MKKHFKIFESCIPVRGVSRSTICDIQRKEIKFIPNDLYDLLSRFDGSSLMEIKKHYGKEQEKIIDEYFEYLIENELGFWCDNPALFPKMDTDWESSSLIENGIIDNNDDSKHDYKTIFKQYEELGCNSLEIRFFSPIPLSKLKEILSLLNESRISSITLLLKYTEEFNRIDILPLFTEFVRIHTISIHSTPKDKLNLLNQSEKIYYFKSFIDSNQHCGIINPKYFTINQSTFLESQNFNTCLNKKISIDVNGDIKNCPSLKSIYGNIKKDSLQSCLKNTEVKKLWTVSKNQIETCSVCEFRHICTDCRAFLNEDNSIEKPKKCNYNPVLMKWE